MNRWFRFYDDVLNDPKVQRLDPALFRAWVNLLCVASKNDGRIPCDDVAFSLRLSEAAAAEIMIALGQAGLMVAHDGFYAPHNWDARQFRSDRDPTNAERQARYRSKNVTDHSNAGVTRYVTPPRADTDTDTDTDRGRRVSAREAPASLVSEVANTTAAKAAAILGYPTPPDWPPGMCGLPMAVQKWMDSGVLPEIIIAETQASASRKRDGPIEHWKYLEKPIIRAQAQHNAPLPTVEIKPEVIRSGTNRPARGPSDAWTRAYDKLLRPTEPQGGTDQCPDTTRLLPPSGRT